VRKRRRDPAPDDGWTSEVSSGFALAGFLALVFVGLTLLSMGPLARFDTYFNLAPPPPSWRPVLHVVDRVGQRAVCLPVLALVTYLVCRRLQSWRPGLIVALSVFSLNLMVLILKVGLGRDSPQSADPSFFTGGMAYPSGHSANVVLVYGLAAYLLLAYTRPPPVFRILLWAAVPVLSVIMVITSLTLNWHWFTDLLSGLVVGGVFLQLTASVDHVLAEVVVPAGWLRAWRQVSGAVRPRRSRGRAGHA
jgi:membrane-associated phospholipid phosphatase